MFLGQFRHNVDEKGRLTIPSRFREQLQAPEGGYVLRGFSRNLMLLPASTFTGIIERLNRISNTDPAALDLKRLILGYASEVEFDKVGRILLPQVLRQFAGLDGEAVLVGVGDFIEIWSEPNWQQQMDQLQDPGENSRRFSAFDLPFH